MSDRVLAVARKVSSVMPGRKNSVTSGTLANTRTSGTDMKTPNTLVLRDASGNFSAGTITATLNGNAATATSATTATNATQLNGQSASFYANASNITAGTLAVRFHQAGAPYDNLAVRKALQRED